MSVEKTLSHEISNVQKKMKNIEEEKKSMSELAFKSEILLESEKVNPELDTRDLKVAEDGASAGSLGNDPRLAPFAKNDQAFLQGGYMKDGFVKLYRSSDLILEDPFAFLVLSLIALRAKREDDPESGLKTGEALIGFEDLKGFGQNPGLTRANHRTAIKHLIANHKITIKVTNKGTIATLCDSAIYDINPVQGNQQANHKVTTKVVQANHKVTTNKNIINTKKEEITHKAEVVPMPDQPTDSLAMLAESIPSPSSVQIAIGDETIPDQKSDNIRPDLEISKISRESDQKITSQKDNSEQKIVEISKAKRKNPEPSEEALEILVFWNDSLSKNIPSAELAKKNQAHYFDRILNKGISKEEIKIAITFAHTHVTENPSDRFPGWKFFCLTPSYFSRKANQLIPQSKLQKKVKTYVSPNANPGATFKSKNVIIA